MKQLATRIIKSVVPEVESAADIEVEIHIVNWMYEAQSDNTISIMLGEKRVRFKAYKDEMLPMDYFSLGYCMSHSKCQWLQSLTGMSGLSKEKITMLCKGTAGPVKGNVIDYILCRNTKAPIWNCFSLSFFSYL